MPFATQEMALEPLLWMQAIPQPHWLRQRAKDPENEFMEI
jgi:hypothetical protein